MCRYELVLGESKARVVAPKRHRIDDGEKRGSRELQSNNCSPSSFDGNLARIDSRSLEVANAVLYEKGAGQNGTVGLGKVSCAQGAIGAKPGFCYFSCSLQVILWR
jgi:hypothetical protein